MDLAAVSEKNSSRGAAVHGDCLKDSGECNLAAIQCVYKTAGTHEAEMWVGHWGFFSLFELGSCK